MDFKSDILHGDLVEEIYMEQPHDFMIYSTLVCQFKKSLYGLKKPPWSWYDKIDHLFSILVSNVVNLIIVCMYCLLIVILLLLLFMLMTWFSLETLLMQYLD